MKSPNTMLLVAKVNIRAILGPSGRVESWSTSTRYPHADLGAPIGASSGGGGPLHFLLNHVQNAITRPEFLEWLAAHPNAGPRFRELPEWAEILDMARRRLRKDLKRLG